ALLLRREQLVLQPREVLDLIHAVDEPTELLDRQLAIRHAASFGQDLRRDVGIEALLALRLNPLEQALTPLGLAAGHALTQVEALEDRVDLLEIVGRELRAHRVALKLLQVAQPALDLVLRVIRRAHGEQVDELVALLGRRLYAVAFGKRAVSGASCASLRGRELRRGE